MDEHEIMREGGPHERSKEQVMEQEWVRRSIQTTCLKLWLE